MRGLFGDEFPELELPISDGFIPACEFEGAIFFSNILFVLLFEFCGFFLTTAGLLARFEELDAGLGFNFLLIGNFFFSEGLVFFSLSLLFAFLPTGIDADFNGGLEFLLESLGF